MTEIFYLLAAVSMGCQTVLLALVALRAAGGVRPTKWAMPEEDRESADRQRAWNEGFSSLLSYDLERAKGSVRDDGR